MADTLLSCLVLTAAVGSGLIGGLFFAFSTFVMKAFDHLPPSQAIAAMQEINVTVLNPLFFTALFGTAIAAIGLATIAALDWSHPVSGFVLIGAAAYLLGSILVTIVFNVPLNHMLAGIRPRDGDGDAADAWKRYRQPWTTWNHVRTVASLAASAVFVTAMGL